MSLTITNLRSDALEIAGMQRRSMDAKRLDITAETVVRFKKKFYGIVTIGWTGAFVGKTATIKGFYEGEANGCVIRDTTSGLPLTIDFGVAGDSQDLDQLAVYDEVELTFNAAITTGGGNEIYVGLGA